jgi:hypothetical protein
MRIAGKTFLMALGLTAVVMAACAVLGAVVWGIHAACNWLGFSDNASFLVGLFGMLFAGFFVVSLIHVLEGGQ